MRRPRVHERSVPPAPRGVWHEDGADHGPAARAAITALPILLQADATGAVELARLVGQALSEAEGT